MINDWVFITDLHITTSSNVRTGDLVDDLSKKLEWVVDYCNDNNAALLLGGDLFDRPSVPDYLKTHFAKILCRVHNKVYSVTGNHCRLYNNNDYAYRTSYNLLAALGVFVDLDSIEGVDFGPLYLTGRVPVITRNKPQIIVYHGFLNQEDGLNTFRFSDLQTEDPCIVFLGHDHVVYPVLQYTDKIRIYRPGSFQRNTREESQNRIPCLLHVRMINGSLKVKTVPIKAARLANEIFKTKVSDAASTRVVVDLYQDLIGKLQLTLSQEENLYALLSKVTDLTTVNYIKTFDNE